MDLTLTLPEATWNLILQGLSKLPYEQSAHTIQGVQSLCQQEIARLNSEAKKKAEEAKASTPADKKPAAKRPAAKKPVAKKTEAKAAA